MTTPTNWPNPERPGVPMFPDRDGWHWLSNRPNDTPFPAEWSHEDCAYAETEWFWDMGEEQVDAYEMRTLYYHGPCPFPHSANEAISVALNNIATLTEHARKNIAVAYGARKMEKTVLPILGDIDRQVIAARNSMPVFTPAQITEMLADERERCAKACESLAPRDGYSILGNVGDNIKRAAKEIRNIGAAP